MSRRNCIYVALGFVALVVVGALVFAGGNYCKERSDSGLGYRGGHGMGMSMGMNMVSERGMRRLSRKLDLDDTQRDTLQSAMEGIRPAMHAVREQLRESRRALYDLDPSAANYDAEVTAIARTRGELMNQMTVMTANMKSTFAEVLNETQMQKFMKRMQRWRHKSKSPA